ncbi:hypothetical protein [Chelativorans sp. YIM 93263]|uniref:hypothetical protein n=1 Tax=Chelativorans sp. YIM 93263 TaxID=2906648 RepID=UPI002379A57A|nr:hypothetical protein [Chelativorans sp. YIM 93263]
MDDLSEATLGLVDPMRAFCMALSAAITVIIASALGEISPFTAIFGDDVPVKSKTMRHHAGNQLFKF